VAEQEPERTFSVVDRRRRGEDEPSAPPPGGPTAAPPPPPRPEAPVPPLADPTLRGAPPADFASFCVMLGSEALMHLGQVPDPMTGQAHQDLEQAQFTIDLLGMLQEKTAGNRTPQESAVLEQLLTNLRMAFVQASRRR
jgi:uncharacterized protein DUF1844